LQLKPADPKARELLPVVAHGLTFLGWQAHQQGRDDEAIGLLDQAADLLPSHDLEQRRFAVLTSGFHDTEAEVAKLEGEANAHPNDFYAHQRLDYALSKRRDWNRIATMWNRFLLANPEHGRAYYERSGTLYNLGRRDASRADVLRACELGVSAACREAGGR
jgi:tetratricopeptide (TPR) repeat protein